MRTWRRCWPRMPVVFNPTFSFPCHLPSRHNTHTRSVNFKFSTPHRNIFLIIFTLILRVFIGSTSHSSPMAQLLTFSNIPPHVQRLCYCFMNTITAFHISNIILCLPNRQRSLPGSNRALLVRSRGRVGDVGRNRCRYEMVRLQGRGRWALKATLSTHVGIWSLQKYRKLIVFGYPFFPTRVVDCWPGRLSSLCTSWPCTDFAAYFDDAHLLQGRSLPMNHCSSWPLATTRTSGLFQCPFATRWTRLTQCIIVIT